MTKSERETPRKPATKFPKMQKQKVQAKKPKKGFFAQRPEKTE